MAENKENKRTICSLCFNSCEEDAPVLAMGPYGNPRYICSECSRDLDTATLGKEIPEIKEAMKRLGEKISRKNPDELSLETANGILNNAADRARLIEAGEYDFSLDEEKDEEELLDIPEEQKESEEDKLLDKQDEEKNKKFDKFYNWVLLGAAIGVVGFIIWKIVEAFL